MMVFYPDFLHIQIAQKKANGNFPQDMPNSTIHEERFLDALKERNQSRPAAAGPGVSVRGPAPAGGAPPKRDESISPKGFAG